MALRPSRPLLYGVALWGAGWLALVLALQRDAPLFVNLGPGDAPFARGFRGGWERDGATQSGATAFHWTEDGARLEVPVVVLDGQLQARMRLARFAGGEAELTLLAGGRVIERWKQAPRGWDERRFDLGEPRGPLMLRFRSEGPADDALGVALDWVEISGATRVLPRRELAPGLLGSLLAAPALVAIFAGIGAGVGFAAFVAWLGASAIFLDRLGGLCALAEAGRAAPLILVVLGALFSMLGRLWREQLAERGARIVPAAGALLACLALLQPFFHYPDVDTHARFLAAIRADPWTAFDAREFQLKNGAWIRSIGDQKIAFPYAPFFHLSAWPLATLLGETSAVKAGAAAALGLSLFLAYGLGRALGLPPPWAILAQGLLALLPVTASRLTLALFPTLFGQALEALLALHLVRRFGHLDGARDAAAATLFLFAAQAAYTGSIFNVAALALVFAALQAALGERRRALRLLGAYAVAAAAAALLLYARFVPVFLKDVLPYAGRVAAGADPDALPPGAGSRIASFYDTLLPLLALAGLWLARDASTHARRWAAAALVAGAGLLGLRGVLPTLLRDVKDVELLAVPVAVLAAVTLRRAWEAGEAGRVAAVGLLAAVLVWAVPRGAELYAARFVAIGR